MNELENFWEGGLTHTLDPIPFNTLNLKIEPHLWVHLHIENPVYAYET